MTYVQVKLLIKQEKSRAGLYIIHQLLIRLWNVSTAHQNRVRAECDVSGKKWVISYTVMAKNICTLAILSENATLLSENCSNYKCFGTHMFIVFVCTATTQTNREEKSNLVQNCSQIVRTLINFQTNSSRFGYNSVSSHYPSPSEWKGMLW